METLRDLEQELYELNEHIKAILDKSGYSELETLERLDFNKRDPEQYFLSHRLSGVLYDLEKVRDAMEYLQEPVKAEGQLHKNSRGRYCLEDHEITSGCRIEILLSYTEWNNDTSMDEILTMWKAVRVEHNGNDYYIVGYDELSMDGLTARIR